MAIILDEFAMMTDYEWEFPCDCGRCQSTLLHITDEKLTLKKETPVEDEEDIE